MLSCGRSVSTQHQWKALLQGNISGKFNSSGLHTASGISGCAPFNGDVLSKPSMQLPTALSQPCGPCPLRESSFSIHPKLGSARRTTKAAPPRADAAADRGQRPVLKSFCCIAPSSTSSPPASTYTCDQKTLPSSVCREHIRACRDDAPDSPPRLEAPAYQNFTFKTFVALSVASIPPTTLHPSVLEHWIRGHGLGLLCLQRQM